MNVLLIPGSLCDERLFAHQVASLVEAGHDCVVAELRPHISIESMATQAATLFDGEAFAVMGLSLGGIVAAELAATVPELLMGAALFDTNLDAPQQAQLDQRKAWEAQVRSGGLWRLVADDLVPVQTSFPERHGQLIFAMAEAHSSAGFLSENQALLHRHDRRDNLNDLDVPVLIAVGDEDLVCSPPLHRDLADRLPLAQLSIIDRAGHLATLDQPAAATALLHEWLASCESHNEEIQIYTQEGNHDYQRA